jgi:hypothetical protein
MNKLYVKLSFVVVGGLLFCNTIAAQAGPYAPAILLPAPKAAHVRITQGPELEMANDKFAIITWTSDNPGGSDEHYGIVHYGKNPNELSQTAKSPIRVNRNHSYTVFRVRVEGLSPHTIYYYAIDAMGADGTGDGVKSGVNQFSTR